MDVFWRMWIILVVYCVQVSTEENSNCSSPLGLENGKISNDRFTASTQKSGKESYRGRLGDISAWCASVQDTNQYLQIDLGRKFSISSISTQGFAPDNWVTKYSISTSEDATTWTMYSDNDKTMEFQGNANADKTKQNVLPSRTTARYVRFLPAAFNNQICARLEIYGCEAEKEDTEAITIFLIVASVIAGILLICALVFVGIYIKRYMSKKERQEARYFPEIDFFTADIGRKRHSLSSYAAYDAIGYPKSAGSLNVRALNMKLANRQSEMNSLSRERAAESKREMEERSKREENAESVDIDFSTSMNESAFGGNVLQKQNPMFKG